MQFFYSSAQIQMLYAHLFHHCIALRNLHTVADAKALRPEVGPPFFLVEWVMGLMRDGVDERGGAEGD